MVPAPTTRHQRISNNLNSLLRQQVKHYRLGEVLYAPVDVILGQGDAREVVQPDLVFVAATRREIVKLHGIEGPPDLVAEILSPGTEEPDRGYKLKMYARHGVLEYWIVDPEMRTIDVYKLGASEYLPANRYSETDVMACRQFGNLDIALNEVFAE